MHQQTQANDHCNECRLIVPCLANGGLEIRVCAICNNIFYGRAFSADERKEEFMRPMKWRPHANRFVQSDAKTPPEKEIPCLSSSLLEYREDAKRRSVHKWDRWRCSSCAILRSVGAYVNGTDDFGEPHIVTEPADSIGIRGHVATSVIIDEGKESK